MPTHCHADTLHGRTDERKGDTASMADKQLANLGADELEELARALAPILAPLIHAEFLRLQARNGGKVGLA